MAERAPLTGARARLQIARMPIPIAALARLLLEDRAIWLLDEPASPLDQEGRALLGTLLDQHARRGGIILAAVHDPLPGVAARVLNLGTHESEVAA